LLSKYEEDMSLLSRVGISYLIIPKEHVLEKNISNFENFVDTICLVQLGRGQENYAIAVLSIDGFNNDPRSLWHIPEVREWFKALHLARPYAPYFISPASIQICITCLVPFLPDVLPKEYAALASKHHPIDSLVTYAMDQYINLLRTIMLSYPDELKNFVLSEANERVFSAVRNMNAGINEPL
jgi:hypothetical protein